MDQKPDDRVSHPEKSHLSPREELANKIMKTARETYEAHKNIAADKPGGTPVSSHEERRTQQRSALNEFVNRMQLEINPTEIDATPAHGITMTQYEVTGGELPTHITELLKIASHKKGVIESFVITSPKASPHVGLQPITLFGLDDDRMNTTDYFFIRSGDDPSNFAMDGLRVYHEEADSPTASFTSYNHNLNLIEIADAVIRPLRLKLISTE